MQVEAQQHVTAAPGMAGRDTAEVREEFPDERLRLFFTCCHPALSLEAQTALTLRCLAGLSTPAAGDIFQHRVANPLDWDDDWGRYGHLLLEQADGSLRSGPGRRSSKAGRLGRGASRADRHGLPRRRGRRRSPARYRAAGRPRPV